MVSGPLVYEAQRTVLERWQEFCWALTFWEDTLKYLYLPRLKNRDSLVQAIRTGASSTDFFGTAYGVDGDKYTGFHVGEGNMPRVQDEAVGVAESLHL